jgi:hypothetical protein
MDTYSDVIQLCEHPIQGKYSAPRRLHMKASLEIFPLEFFTNRSTSIFEF